MRVVNRFLCGLLLLAAPSFANAQVLTDRGTHVPRSPDVRPAMLHAPSSMPVHPAVARVFVAEKGIQSVGSGTLVDVRDQFGLVITNWHVVKDATGEISVVFPDGFRSAGRVVKYDADWDLAALSIWRPKAAPVRISLESPQRGEPLTIAGYGSDGLFRAVTGPCTQYLAPSDKHPHEIVELAAQARQGDSGGPILNRRGELAGVLFGTADNTTSGSYGPRVLKFLEPVLKGDVAMTGPSTAASPPTSTNAPADVVNKVPVAALQPEAGAAPDALALARPAAPLAPVLPDEAAAISDQLRIVHTPLNAPMGVAQIGNPSTATDITSSPFAQDLIGRTPIEQAKAALSVVGLIALLMVAFRLGRSEPKNDD